MAEVLLTSEVAIKAITNISDNVAGKYLLSALREAQEIKLKGIIGSSLLEVLKNAVAANTLRDIDKELLERVRYYLAYTTIAELVMKVTYKVGNMGVVKTSDENLSVATPDEISRNLYYYQSKADFYCAELQRWLCNNRNAFLQLSDCDCARMKANLTSAASCGIYLGGARGKRR